MLNLQSTQLHYNYIHYRYWCFFFKFLKIKNILKKKNWLGGNYLLTKKFKLLCKTLIYKLTKKKKYKPYNFFKFSILKYKRFFTPTYLYHVNSFLLTRYNFLYQKSNFISYTPKIYVRDYLITRINNNSTIINNIYRIVWLQKKIFKFRYIRKLNFYKKKKYKIKQKNFVFWRWENKLFLKTRWLKKIKRYNKKCRKLKWFFNKSNRIFFNKFKKQNYLIKTKKKFIKTYKQYNYNCVSKLTNYNYSLKTNNRLLKLNLYLYKILFNSYNHKTYNWRIVN